jgi:type IV secretion system protein VirD4
LRGVYGGHVADEIVANCGVEVAFTPKELRVANDLSERLGYTGQDSITKSLTINGLLANRSKSISEQRRALLLPQELMQFPSTKLILLRGGIPPIIGEKLVYFKSRFFKARAFPAPAVPAIPRAHTIRTPSGPARDMTEREAAGDPAARLAMDDICTADHPSVFVDVGASAWDGTMTLTVEEGDEYA